MALKSPPRHEKAAFEAEPGFVSLSRNAALKAELRFIPGKLSYRQLFSDPFPSSFSAVTLDLGRFSQGILQKLQHRLKEIKAQDSQMNEMLFGESLGEETKEAPAPVGMDPETAPSPATSPLSPRSPSCRTSPLHREVAR